MFKILKYSQLNKYLRINWLICLTLLLQTLVVKAQDIHYTQFYTTPILTNPANTAMFDDDIRFASNYRDQWLSIGVPYRTLYASLDGKANIFNQNFGLGCMIIRDQAALNLSANELLLSLSYSKFIHNHQFTIGIQPGYVSKSYNLNDLTFGTQFDASSQQYNSSLASSEILQNSLNYLDLNAGIYWRTLYHNIMPSAGFSMSHILRPSASFSSSGSETTRIPIKYTFNSQVIVPVNNFVDVTPSLLWGNTSGVNEFLLGCIEGYKLTEYRLPVKKIYAINMFRFNPFRNIDAFILGVGFKFTKLDVGISYDFNVSSLSGSSTFNGAFELSIIYTGGKNKKNNNEPCFIY